MAAFLTGAVRNGIETHDPASADLLQALLDDLGRELPDDSEAVSLLRRTHAKLDSFQFQEALPILEQAELHLPSS